MAFLIETGKNKTMRNENMARKTVEELLDVANRYSFMLISGGQNSQWRSKHSEILIY